jgi:hypothetical protein
LATHGWKEDFDGAATNDVDADGMPTWTEYLAGTDPTNRASFLGFDNVAQNSTGTGVVLRWHSVNGKFYRIERGTNLMAIQCFDTLVQTNILGIAPLNEETDKTAVGHGPHFYRITLE